MNGGNNGESAWMASKVNNGDIIQSADLYYIVLQAVTMFQRFTVLVLVQAEECKRPHGSPPGS